MSDDSTIVIGLNYSRAIMFLDLLREANRDNLRISCREHFVTNDGVRYQCSSATNQNSFWGVRAGHVYVDSALKGWPYHEDVLRIVQRVSFIYPAIIMYYDLDELSKGGLI